MFQYNINYFGTENDKSLIKKLFEEIDLKLDVFGKTPLNFQISAEISKFSSENPKDWIIKIYPEKEQFYTISLPPNTNDVSVNVSEGYQDLSYKSKAVRVYFNPRKDKLY